MKARKNHSPDFKAKVALEAIREEMALAELSKKYGVHPTQTRTWKRAAIEHMATAFIRKGSAPERVSPADVDKLHSKIGQLVVEREAKNGEQGSQAEYASPVRVANVVAVQFVL